MTGLEAVLAVAGFAVTVLVIAGMILITRAAKWISAARRRILRVRT